MFIFCKNLSSFYLMILSTQIVISHELEPLIENDDVQRVLEKYFKKVPDINSNYVINEGLSKIIASYFNGTVNAFPLFKISIKVDRKPIKIPWTLDQGTQLNDTHMRKRYKYVKVQKVDAKGN